jgi:hypothetical protein
MSANHYRFPKFRSVIYQNLSQPTSYNVHVKVNTIRASDKVVVNNATFNNISAISWRSVLLVEETGVPGVLNFNFVLIILVNY